MRITAEAVLSGSKKDSNECELHLPTDIQPQKVTKAIADINSGEFISNIRAAYDEKNHLITLQRTDRSRPLLDCIGYLNVCLELNGVNVIPK